MAKLIFLIVFLNIFLTPLFLCMKKLSMDELNRLNIEQFHNAPKSPVILILDNIRSLFNIGSVFRTADAFRIEKIYLCGITGTPPHREIQKSALGSTQSVDWEYYKNSIDIIKKLKNENVKIIAVEQTDNSVYLNKYHPSPDKKAYIFGNEISGVSDDILPLTELCLEIPQFGTKHSFNVAVSAGIVLWHDFLHSYT